MRAPSFSPAARNFFDARAIDPELAAAYGVREVGGELAFPYVSPDGSSFDRLRSLNGNRGTKVKQPTGQPLTLWWASSRPKAAEAVLVCEGESDALAALEPLSESSYCSLEVVATPGTGFPPKRLAEQLAEVGVREAFLAFDGDEAGRSYCDKAGAALRKADIRSIVVALEDGTDLADNLARADDRARWLNNALAEAEAVRSWRQRDDRDRREGASVAYVASVADWPEPPAEQAFHGLAGRIVRTIEPHSEADPAALLASVLVAFGNACGRGPGFRAEGDFHATNLYAVVVGETAKGRKGTSWGQARRPFAVADPGWTSERLAGGLTSGEGLIYHVRDSQSKQVPLKEKGKPTGEYVEEVVDEGVADKRLLIFEGEFAQVLKVMGREGNTLSPVVRDLWDRGEVRTLSKNSPLRATDALVSILAHVTADELRRGLTGTEVANGFANRFLFVCARRSKVLPEGGALGDEEIHPLADELRQALRFASVQGILERDAEARALWAEVYGELSEGRPGLLGAATSRAEAQVMRLAVLYALLDQSSVVRAEQLRAALALWDYCLRSAAYVFGTALGDPLADELLDRLRRAGPTGLTRTEIRDAFKRHRQGEEIDRALGLLEARALAGREDQATGGRPVERWYAT